MPSRIAAITGLGLVGPTGFGVEAFWSALRSATPAITPIDRFDSSSFSCRVAGQVDSAALLARLSERTLRNTPRASQLAIVAAQMALRDAGFSDAPLDSDAAVAVGTALGGWTDAEQQGAVLLERGARRVNPFLISGAGSHGPGSEVAALIGATGPLLTFSAGCISGLQAIAHGAQLVREGRVKLCVAGGTEAPLSPLIFASLCRTKELSTVTGDPGESSRPFDVRHSGIVLAEGSCFAVIENLHDAIRSGHRVYATVLGSDGSCDARGLYSVDESGKVGASSVLRLLTNTGVRSDEVDYICAHANSAPIFDRKEISVISRAFGNAYRGIHISSIKGTMGHPFGASGAFQVAAAALAISQKELPPTANFTEPAVGCEGNHIVGSLRVESLRTAMVTSYGYGGFNGYLLLGSAA